MNTQHNDNAATSHDVVIAARDLTKRYGKSTVVDAINFNIIRGEVFGLLGPNGAGKTTTILMMLGLTEISAGRISVLGFDPARAPLKVKRHVGYLPDAVGFYDHLTAVENLAYVAKLMGLSMAERTRRIVAALSRVRLLDVANRRVATYSRGMRQRLGLAEIIVKRAEIAILDEPTSGLDPQATLEFLELIRELKAEGVTVLLSSHMLDQVQRVCDRVALFQAGKIVMMGSVAELAVQVLGAGFVVEVEAEGAGIARRLAAIPGVGSVETLADDRFRMIADRDVRPDAARVVVAADGVLRRLSVDEPSLEAIYAHQFQAKQARGVQDAA
ncbi:ABC transporter ATP-binding protein [Bradyrhizobium jicamae]|uniref:ABC transporter ATP-binding protein n=1 Tax=Bradyrhizobium jicamae TaxID=280332 RepID=UPI001BA7C299|nr:ABC transporter ATP-binding protein [Bradyrhizobium jicamae]MBR0751524.1 ABC transporter ATP-binding protein [Bradyrhizobium jicamae]